MKTRNFEKLIQSITGRDFTIDTTENEIVPDTEYRIFRILPIGKNKIWFNWKSPKTEEKFLKTFITAFCNKYKEPNPKCYDKIYGGVQYLWDDKTEEQKEFCYYNHSSNMYHKDRLLEQVKENFASPILKGVLIEYGFYSTLYGVGTFALWMTKPVIESIERMSSFLQSKGIPYANEYSDAGWVLRFKINLTKELHNELLNEFSQIK